MHKILEARFPADDKYSEPDTNHRAASHSGSVPLLTTTICMQVCCNLFENDYSNDGAK